MTPMEKDIMIRAVKYCVEQVGMEESDCWKYRQHTLKLFWDQYLKGNDKL